MIKLIDVNKDYERVLDLGILKAVKNGKPYPSHGTIVGTICVTKINELIATINKQQEEIQELKRGRNENNPGL